MPSGTVAITAGEIAAHALQFTLPAGLLRAFVPALGALAPDGAIDVQAPSFTWRDPVASGRVDASWRNARLAIAGVPVSLGRVVGAAAGAPDGMAGSSEGRGGDVAVSGTWRLRGDALQGATTLAPTDATPPALRAMLPLLGPADANGAVHLDWRGRR
jgi:hypothetical protein